MSKIPEILRYSEKRYLSNFDLYVDLFDEFDIKVNDVVPLRSVYVIFTNKGKKVLKKLNYSIEDINFIIEVIKYVKRSFPRVMDFTKTTDGKNYIIWRGEAYCIMELIEGRECQYNNPLDVKVAIKGLAEFHKAGEGFRPNNRNKKTIGKAIDIYERRLQEMYFFKSLAELHEIKSDFDKIFLNDVDYYIKDIENSIELLKKSSYLKLCSEEDKSVICHQDLAHHNIIINEEQAYFVDFDFAVVDLKVLDLSNFIVKAIKDFAFDIEKAKTIISEYSSINNIDKREMEVLYAFLNFPEDFYSISKDYYTRRKDWDEEVFLDRLLKKVQFKEDREVFLKEFKAIL